MERDKDLERLIKQSQEVYDRGILRERRINEPSCIRNIIVKALLASDTFLASLFINEAAFSTVALEASALVGAAAPVAIGAVFGGASTLYRIGNVKRDVRDFIRNKEADIEDLPMTTAHMEKLIRKYFRPEQYQNWLLARFGKARPGKRFFQFGSGIDVVASVFDINYYLQSIHDSEVYQKVFPRIYTSDSIIEFVTQNNAENIIKEYIESDGNQGDDKTDKIIECLKLLINATSLMAILKSISSSMGLASSYTKGNQGFLDGLQDF